MRDHHPENASKQRGKHGQSPDHEIGRAERRRHERAGGESADAKRPVQDPRALTPSHEGVEEKRHDRGQHEAQVHVRRDE